MKLRWDPWDRTHDGVQEWTRWDAGGSWFLAVLREKWSLLWKWSADYAPDDAPLAAEHDSWAFTKAGAMAKAQAYAEKNDRRMRGG